MKIEKNSEKEINRLKTQKKELEVKFREINFEVEKVK